MAFNRFLTSRAAAGTLALALTLSACDSNEPDNGGGDQEFITGVTITMTNTAAPADVVTLTATDTDGDGGGIVFTPARATLRRGATYTATIRLTDAVNGTVVSDEVAEEAEDHLFRYAFDPAAAGTVAVTDRESQYITTQTGADLPVGLAFRVTTAAAASGNATLNATLFHFSDPADKASATATSDERDIDIDFPVAFAAPAIAATTGN